MPRPRDAKWMCKLLGESVYIFKLPLAGGPECGTAVPAFQPLLSRPMRPGGVSTTHRTQTEDHDGKRGMSAEPGFVVHADVALASVSRAWFACLIPQSGLLVVWSHLVPPGPTWSHLCLVRAWSEC